MSFVRYKLSNSNYVFILHTEKNNTREYSTLII